MLFLNEVIGNLEMIVRNIRGHFHNYRTIRNYSKNRANGKTKIGSKVALSIVVGYSTYALYVSGKANHEITERAKQLRNLHHLSFEATWTKYAPLQVLGRYENPFNEYRIQTVYEFFFNRVVELFERNRGGLPHLKEQMDELMPIHKPTWSSKPLLKSRKISARVTGPFEESEDTENTPIKSLHFTWLGQSCCFVVLDNMKILTDPLFSTFLINQTFGPKRITDLPCSIEDVPTPDIILLSHNHPDHVDEISLKYWGDDHPDRPLWLIPKGLGSFMATHNVSNYIELSWWESCELSLDGQNYQISATPAMHWSGRSVFDANHSLWCSFMVNKNNKPVLFHAGDTGYVNDLYTRIAEKYGSGVKLALLPCGQYCPQWHQKPRHINPEEAMKIMKDLNAENVLGIHWGTFILSGEYFREPKEKLEFLAQFNEIDDRCYCPELGKTISYD